MNKKDGAYKHNHTHNARARESDERKISMLKNMEVKRLQKAVDKQIDNMRKYLPPGTKKQIPDPAYELKGAARPAREFYQRPDFIPDIEETDLMELHRTSMWSHEEGRVLLEQMLALGVALHNVSKRTKESVDVLSEMISYDPEDNM
eukprot:gene5661-11423_t